MKRWLLWIVVLLVLGVGGYFGVRKYLASTKTGPQYETAKVDKGSIVARVTATGTLSALVTVQVGSQVSGRIKALYADYNSQVKKGQLLAKLDPQGFQASMAQAQANLMAAKGNLARSQAQAEIARIQHDRSKQLLEKNLIAQSDYDTARATLLSTQAEVQVTQGSVAQATANIRQAQINLAYTDIVSPVDGIVISRSVDVGQTVAASLQAPTIFTIAEDLRKMQVDTSVSEADVGKLEPNMQATFTVDAFPGLKFKGTVRQIRNAPVTVQSVVTYDAVIDVENAELKLKPGMTATVSFIYSERNDVVRIPNAALRFKPSAEELAAAASASGSSSAGRRGPRGDGPPRERGERGEGRPNRGEGGPVSDRKTVYVLREGRLEPVRVKTGLTDGSYTELLEGGLKEGDLVITSSSASSSSTSGGSQQQQRGPGGPGRIL